MSEQLSVTAPYDRKLIATLDLDGEDVVEDRLSRARGLADDPDARLPLHQRMEILEKTAQLVESRAEEFAKQAAHEGGKPLVDSRIELERAVQGIREAARSVAQLVGREIPMQLNEASVHRRAYTFREPIGVVVAISAFNHPFNLIVHQVTPAIAVGCPVIVKPAEVTPLSCRSLLKCLYEAGLPEEWCQMVLCDTKNAEKLATDPRVDYLSFIGSERVGWMLRSKLSPGTRCGLEHGGVAPVLVEADADLETALPGLVKGAFYHAGQVCVSVQRVFVHEDIARIFADKIVAAAGQLTVGDPLQPKTDVGPLIRPAALERVETWVREAKVLGAEVLLGGERLGETCFQPTVLWNPSDEAEVSQQEIFGPVLALYTYRDRREAIHRANAVRFSFQAAIFTRDLEAAFDCVQRLNAKAVMINDHTAFRVDWMPFGGRKASGLGVGGILPAMQEMSEEKMFIIKSPVL